MKRSWRDNLMFGLPEKFDFTVIKTTADAASLIFALPNADRGEAGKGLYDQRRVIGNAVAYCGLMHLWDHDHREVSSAFGSREDFLAALREVAPAPKRKRAFRIWRGVTCVNGIAGPSWTTNRDVACWFAMRHTPATPLVLTCAAFPDDIIAEHNERNEREVIVDPSWIWDHITLDDPISGTKQSASDFEDDPPLVSPELLADWREAFERWEKRKNGSMAA
jgi:hypothetical protein